MVAVFALRERHILQIKEEDKRRTSALVSEWGRDLENLQWKKQTKNGNKDAKCKDNPLFHEAVATTLS